MHHVAPAQPGSSPRKPGGGGVEAGCCRDGVGVRKKKVGRSWEGGGGGKIGLLRGLRCLGLFGCVCVLFCAAGVVSGVGCRGVVVVYIPDGVSVSLGRLYVVWCGGINDTEGWRGRKGSVLAGNMIFFFWD
jgi:hypothetical protein